MEDICLNYGDVLTAIIVCSISIFSLGVIIFEIISTHKPTINWILLSIFFGIITPFVGNKLLSPYYPVLQRFLRFFNILFLKIILDGFMTIILDINSDGESLFIVINLLGILKSCFVFLLSPFFVKRFGNENDKL